jgi:hypothetical protein
MIDFETLDTSNFPALLSIGAVAFDLYAPNEFIEFHKKIKTQTSIDLGGSVSFDTFAWWLRQSKDARDYITNQKDAVAIDLVFQDLELFIKSNKIKYVWSHGSSFDVTIAENYFEKLKIDVPWKYWNIRDTRTIFDLTKIKRTEFQGTKHNALDDAKMQAVDVQRCYCGFKSLMDKLNSLRTAEGSGQGNPPAQTE